MLEGVGRERIVVSLSNHAGYDRSVELMAKLAKRRPREPRPFVVGTETAQHTLQVMGACDLRVRQMRMQRGVRKRRSHMARKHLRNLGSGASYEAEPARAPALLCHAD